MLYLKRVSTTGKDSFSFMYEYFALGVSWGLWSQKFPWRWGAGEEVE